MQLYLPPIERAHYTVIMPEFSLEYGQMLLFIFLLSLLIFIAFSVGVLVNSFYINKKISTIGSRFKLFMYVLTAILSQVLLVFLIGNDFPLRYMDIVVGFPFTMYVLDGWDSYLHIGGIILNFIIIIFLSYTTDNFVQSLLRKFSSKLHKRKTRI
jgi:hypothetical protein